MTTPTQTTITNEQVLEVLQAVRAELKQENRELKSDIKQTQNILLAVMLAIFFFLGGILWFTRGDVSDLKANVNVIQAQHTTQHP